MTFVYKDEDKNLLPSVVWQKPINRKTETKQTSTASSPITPPHICLPEKQPNPPSSRPPPPFSRSIPLPVLRHHPRSPWQRRSGSGRSDSHTRSHTDSPVARSGRDAMTTRRWRSWRGARVREKMVRFKRKKERRERRELLASMREMGGDGNAVDNGERVAPTRVWVVEKMSWLFWGRE